MEISLLQFEEMIDRLEKGSGQQVGTAGLRLPQNAARRHMTEPAATHFARCVMSLPYYM